jgi:replication factor C large subunit
MITNTSIPWTRKYRPSTLSQVIGNKKAISKVLNWLEKWNNPAFRKNTRSKKGVLLHGPPGIGKTVTVESIANDYNYALIEMNASDFRSAKQIKKGIARSIGYHSLDETLYKGTKRMFLFDEVDGISGRDDRGGVGAIVQILKKTWSPVFLTANDIYHPRLRNLRQHCVQIGFQKVAEEEIITFLREICKREGITAETAALFSIVQNAAGDVRVAINDLQMMGEGKNRLRPEDIVVSSRNERIITFEALRRFFSAKTWNEAKQSIDEAAIDYEIFMLCVHESLPYQFKNPHDLAVVYNVLSKANIFLANARKQRAWKLMRYFFDLLTGIPFLRTHGWPSNLVRFSQKLTAMSRSRVHRQRRSEMGQLIGEKCHLSSKNAIRTMVPYLKGIFSANPEYGASIAQWLELDEAMINLLSSHSNSSS